MLEYIKVKNFRSIDNLEVESLRKVNIFVGENNCGKTTLLEAIYLNLNSLNPSSLMEIYINIRRLKLIKDTANNIFSMFDIDKNIEITTIDSNKQSLELKILYTNNKDYSISNEALNNSFDTYPTISFYINGENTPYHINIMNTQNTIQSGSQSLRGVFINSNTMLAKTKQAISTIRKLNLEDTLRQYLIIFDKNIIDVEMINNDIMIKTKDMPEKVIVNLLGEGFQRYLCIVASIIADNSQCNYICIDEIENGLHFKAIKKLFVAIIEFANKSNVQLFITTHSNEVLRALNDIYIEQADDNTAIFKISRTKNLGLQSYKYGIETLSHIIETETEIRG